MDIDQALANDERAEAEAEKRWPINDPPHGPSDWLQTGLAAGFVLGARWATEEDQQ